MGNTQGGEGGNGGGRGGDDGPDPMLAAMAAAMADSGGRPGLSRAPSDRRISNAGAGGTQSAAAARAAAVGQFAQVLAAQGGSTRNVSSSRLPVPAPGASGGAGSRRSSDAGEESEEPRAGMSAADAEAERRALMRHLARMLGLEVDEDSEPDSDVENAKDDDSSDTDDDDSERKIVENASTRPLELAKPLFISAPDAGTHTGAPVPAKTDVRAWGRGDEGQLMQPEPVSSNVPWSVHELKGTRVVSVACGETHTLVVTEDGRLLVSGLNTGGMFAPDQDPNALLLLYPVDLGRVLRPGVTVASVATGKAHAVVLLSSGEVVTFGSNEFGQLGHKAKGAQFPPAFVRTIGRGNRRVIQVAAGDAHTVMLTVAGEVYTCGKGCEGALGHSTRRNVLKPRMVLGLIGVPVVQIAAAGGHTVVVSRSGHAYTWGRNQHGQLGIDTDAVIVKEPTRLQSMSRLIEQAACGENHTVFLTVCGETFACGLGSRGQLGLGPEETENELQRVTVPQRVTFPDEVLSSGGSEDGLRTPMTTRASVRETPRVGLPRSEPSVRHIILPNASTVEELEGDAPTPVATNFRARHVACGSNHTVVLTVLGDVFVFGANTFGQLGLEGMHKSLFSPALLPELSRKGVFAVSAGGDTTVAVRVTSGSVTFASPGTLPPGLIPELDAATLLRLYSQPGSTAQLRSLLVEACTSASCFSASFQVHGTGKIFTTHSTADAALASPPIVSPDVSGVRTVEVIDSTSGGAGGRGPVVFETTLSGDAAPGWTDSDHWKTTSSVDVRGLYDSFKEVLSTNTPLLSEVYDAMRVMLSRFNAAHEYVRKGLEPECLRLLFAFLVMPLYMDDLDLSTPVLVAVVKLMSLQPLERRSTLSNWLARDVPSDIFKNILRVVKDHVSGFIVRLGLSADKKSAFDTVVALCRVYQIMYDANTAYAHVPAEDFIVPTLGLLTEDTVTKDYLGWLHNREDPDSFTFCKYWFMFDSAQKHKFLHIDVDARKRCEMESAKARAVLLNEDPFLSLKVARDSLLVDTIRHLRKMCPSSFKKPLKVTFEGEDAIDAGGVTKEFFQLLSQELFDPDFKMFVGAEGTNDVWFNRCSPRSIDRDFELIGVLVGLAIYNKVMLQLNISPVLFKKLLGKPMGLDELGQVDPGLASSLKYLLDYREPDLEDVFQLTFSASYEDEGRTHTVDLKRNGSNIPVTQRNKRDYVSAYIKWYLVDSIETQFFNFRRGFYGVMGSPVLEIFTPAELQAVLCGVPELDFKELEKSAEYDGFEASNPIVQAFWRVVQAFDHEAKTKFLLFVTGCDKAPIGGLKNLVVKLHRSGGDSNSLPTASTCFNTLHLPEYSSEEKLAEKLMIAIENCQGFGLR